MVMYHGSKKNNHHQNKNKQLKMDGWKLEQYSFLLGQKAHFQKVLLLVSPT